MSIDFDTSQVTVLVDAMDKASQVATKDVEAVVFKGARNITRDASRRISGHPRWRRLPGAIDFDTYRSLKGPAAEIGPNHSKPQGALGHIPEYGGLYSPPTPYMAPSGDAERPRFERAMEDVAVKALGP